jgi:hypothetical protein
MNYIYFVNQITPNKISYFVGKKGPFFKNIIYNSYRSNPFEEFESNISMNKLTKILRLENLDQITIKRSVEFIVALITHK